MTSLIPVRAKRLTLFALRMLQDSISAPRLSIIRNATFTILFLGFTPYRLLSKLLIKMFMSLEYKPLVITNSNFTKYLIKKWLVVTAYVAFLPVNVEKYQTLAGASERGTGD